MAITDRDRLFADLLLEGKQVVDAAIGAGYAETTAYKKAHEWVGKSRKTSKKPELFDYIEQKRAMLEDKFDIKKEDVLRGMLNVAAADIRRMYDSNGNMLPVHLLPDDIVGAIVGIEVKEEKTITGKKTTVQTVVKKIKLAADRTNAWGAIAKLLGYNEAEKVELSGSFLDFLKKAKGGK